MVTRRFHFRRPTNPLESRFNVNRTPEAGNGKFEPEPGRGRLSGSASGLNLGIRFRF